MHWKQPMKNFLKWNKEGRLRGTDSPDNNRHNNRMPVVHPRSTYTSEQVFIRAFRICGIPEQCLGSSFWSGFRLVCSGAPSELICLVTKEDALPALKKLELGIKIMWCTSFPPATREEWRQRQIYLDFKIQLLFMNMNERHADWRRKKSKNFYLGPWRRQYAHHQKVSSNSGSKQEVNQQIKTLISVNDNIVEWIHII